jgi:putative tryptophan/tyrosine transport system substrate-binding protein
MTKYMQFIITFLTILLLNTNISYAKQNVKKVAITQIVHHPSLDMIRKGVVDYLKSKGYRNGHNLKLIFQSAQGNQAIATQISQKFIGDAPDVIVAISTPSAQSIMNANKKTKIPLVFSAVTDPIGAKLVTNLDKPEGFVTGTTDMAPVKSQIEFIIKLQPNIKRIGFLYNAGETNSVSQKQRFENIASSYGIEIVPGVVTKSSDVCTVADSLVGRIEAIYIPNDNTIVSAIESVVKCSEKRKIPVYASDGDSVARGAVFAAGHNQYEVGRKTGGYVVNILRGKKIADLPVQSVDKIDLYINMVQAKKIGLVVPEEMLKQAVKVIRTKAKK